MGGQKRAPRAGDLVDLEAELAIATRQPPAEIRQVGFAVGGDGLNPVRSQPGGIYGRVGAGGNQETRRRVRGIAVVALCVACIAVALLIWLFFATIATQL